MIVEYYLLPGTLPEDIKQEMAIARLTGKKASMKKLMDRKDIGYGLQPLPEAIPIWSIVTRPDYRLFEELAQYILAQEESLKKEILAYLAEPDDGRLATIVRALGNEIQVERKKPLTLTELLFKNLPLTLAEMYVFARAAHPSKKPEAAVRQIIRNMLKRKEVAWESELLCRVGG